MQGQLEPIQSKPTQSELVTLQQCTAEEIDMLNKRIRDLLLNPEVGAALQTAYDNGLTSEKSPNEHGFWVFEELQSNDTSYPDRRFHVEEWRTPGDTCSATTCSIEPDIDLLYPQIRNLEIELFSKENWNNHGRFDPLVAAGHNHPFSDGYVGPSPRDIKNQITRGVPTLIVNQFGRKAFDCTCGAGVGNCVDPAPGDIDDVIDKWGPEWDDSNDYIDPEPPDPLEADTGGEPHIKTFDNFGYDFQAIGDYVLVRSIQPDDDFEIQGRIIPFIPLRLGDSVSVYEAIAIKIAGTVVEFYSSSSGSIEVKVDGTVITNFPHELPLITVERYGSSASLTTSFGHKVFVRNYVRDGSGLISAVSMEIPGSYEGQIEGLLGNGNNDISDELQTRFGVILPTNATDSLYFGGDIIEYFAGLGGDTYRDSWSLFYGASQSLFTKGTDPFSRTYPHSFLSLDDFNAQKVEEAQAACEAAGITDAWALRSCTFDVALTEDLGWIGVYQGLEFSSDLLRITPTFSVVDSGLPTTLSFDVTSFEGGVITDPGDLSWELYGPDLDTTALSIDDATAQFTTTGERGEYTLIVSRISDPSRVTTATVVVADPLAVYPTEAIMMVGESRNFEASIDDGLSVDWSAQFGSIFPNGLSVTYTAPSTPNADTLTAFLQEDTSKRFDVPITVINNELTPTQALVAPNEGISFIWEGAEAVPIIWTASTGTITPNGVYTAPSTIGTYTVTATLAQDSAISVSATIQVVNTPLTVQPTEAIVMVGESQDFEASIDDSFSISWSARFGSIAPNDRFVTYTAPFIPIADTLTAFAQGGVNVQIDVPITVIDNKLTPFQALTIPDRSISFTWEGTGTLPKNWTASAGIITSEGVYNAPSTIGTHTITATLVQDNTISASTTVQVVRSLATELVSLSTNGVQGNDGSSLPSITDDGRYVVFQSSASNLISGDTNNSEDIFLKDVTTGAIQRVSVATDGTQGNGDSYEPSITSDGHYVAFYSDANNLVANDTNGQRDVFLKDITTGAIQLVSRAADGTQGNWGSCCPSVTLDGRYVVFRSFASNLVLGDTNSVYDIFLKDVTTGAIRRVNVAADGTQANLYSFSTSASITPDGRYVVFRSDASNLVSGDTNSVFDIFLKDVTTGAIQRVSTAADGAQGNGHSVDPWITPDGRYVVFRSTANNLVLGDTNGKHDIFLKDVITGTIQRVSVAADGSESNGNSYRFGYSSPITLDGRYVVFRSEASNLVLEDTNNQADIFLKDTITGEIQLVSATADHIEGNGFSDTPSITADGRYIVFYSLANNLVSNDSNGEADVFRVVNPLWTP